MLRYLTIGFKWSVVNLACLFDRFQFFRRGLPTFYQHRAEWKVFNVKNRSPYIQQMVQLTTANPFWGKDSIIDDPERVGIGIDIDTGHNTIPLATNEFDCKGVAFVQTRIIKNDVAIF